MTTVTAEAIPDGSYSLRVFAGESTTVDIETVLVLKNLGGEICEISMAHGHLYDEANILIGMKAYELGFRTLRFHTLPGKTVTRWAHKVQDEDLNFSYYEVDLEQALSEVLSRGAL
jgi:hypothetical protein